MYTHQYATKMMQRSQNCPPQDMERNCWFVSCIKIERLEMLFSHFGVLYFVVLLRRRKKINSATRQEHNYLGDEWQHTGYPKQAPTRMLHHLYWVFSSFFFKAGKSYCQIWIIFIQFSKGEILGKPWFQGDKKFTLKFLGSKINKIQSFSSSDTL